MPIRSRGWTSCGSRNCSPANAPYAPAPIVSEPGVAVGVGVVVVVGVAVAVGVDVVVAVEVTVGVTVDVALPVGVADTVVVGVAVFVARPVGVTVAVAPEPVALSDATMGRTAWRLVPTGAASPWRKTAASIAPVIAALTARMTAVRRPWTRSPFIALSSGGGTSSTLGEPDERTQPQDLAGSDQRPGIVPLRAGRRERPRVEQLFDAPAQRAELARLDQLGQR